MNLSPHYRQGRTENPGKHGENRGKHGENRRSRVHMGRPGLKDAGLRPPSGTDAAPAGAGASE